MRVTSLTASLVGAVTEVRLMYPSPSLDPVKLLLGRAAARPATERRPSEDTLALWLLTGSTSVTSDPAALAPTGSKRATTATAARMSMLSRTGGATPRMRVSHRTPLLPWSAEALSNEPSVSREGLPGGGDAPVLPTSAVRTGRSPN